MSRSSRLLAIALIALLPAVAHAEQSPALSIDKSVLRFTLVVADGRPSAVTPPQVVFIDGAPPQGDTGFSVEATQPWIQVVSQSARAPGRFSIGIVSQSAPSSAGVVSAPANVRRRADGAVVASIDIQLTITGGASKAPIGALDVPPADFAFATGGVMFAGWSLDDVSVTDVEICAGRPGADAQPGPGPCGDAARTLIGRAEFGYGGRPDVMNLFAMPRHERGGWSFALERAALAHLGPGQLEVTAVARDAEGHAAVIGKRHVSLEATVPTIPFPMISVGLLVACFALAQLWLWERVRHAATLPQTVDAAPAIHWAEVALMTAVTTAFVALQIAPMQSGLQYDELHTASHFVVGRSLWDAATSVSVFNNHIAFSLAAGISSRLFGPAEWALRLPSVLFGSMAVVAVWWLARSLSNRAVAAVSAVLIATSPLFFFWSHMARGYAGLALMATASTAAFFAILREPTARMVWLHAMTSVLAVYFNLYGIWIVISQYLMLAVLAFRRSALPTTPGQRRLLVSFSCIAAALVVLHLPIMRDFAAVMEFRGRTPLKTGFPRELYLAYGGAVAWPALNIIAVALAVLGMTRQRRIVAEYFVLSLVLPLIVMWYFVRPLDLYTRFFTYWMPVFAYLLGCGLWALYDMTRRHRSFSVQGILATIGAVAVVACGMLMVDWTRQNRAPAPDGYAGVGRAAVREDGWRSFAIGGDAEMMDYYLPRPVTVLRSAGQLDRALREEPRLQVAYHAMSWNSDAERKLAETLTARCDSVAAGVVTVFHCR